MDSYVVDPESKWLQQIAIVRDKDENALTQRVNEKLAEIKIEGGKLRVVHRTEIADGQYEPEADYTTQPL